MVNVEVTAHALTVRVSPGGNPSGDYLAQGQIATVDSYTPGAWLHMTAPHVGYISSVSNGTSTVKPVDIVVTPPSGDSQHVKTTTSLRVRSGPGLNWPVLTVLPFGAIVTVYNAHNITADGHNWYELYTPVPQWIAGDLTVPVDGSAPTSPPPPQTTPLPPQSLPWTLPFNATMRGVGTNTGGWVPGPNELASIRENDIQIALMVAYNANVAAQAIPLLQQAGIKAFIVRASTYEPITTAQRFLDLTIPILREYYAALGNPQNMMIIVHNEPNLISEGLTKGWANGAGFASWFATVAQTYRSAFPGCKLGYPALSPGPAYAGVREYERDFAQQSIAAIRASDWIGLHAYWAKQDGSDFAPEVAYWKQFGKPVIGTEIGPVGAAVVTPATVLAAYSKLAAQGVPAMAWVLNGTGMFQNADWTKQGLKL